jgi:hypothetical protein
MSQVRLIRLPAPELELDHLFRRELERRQPPDDAKLHVRPREGQSGRPRMLRAARRGGVRRAWPRGPDRRRQRGRLPRGGPGARRSPFEALPERAPARPVERENGEHVAAPAEEQVQTPVERLEAHPPDLPGERVEAAAQVDRVARHEHPCPWRDAQHAATAARTRRRCWSSKSAGTSTANGAAPDRKGCPRRGCGHQLDEPKLGRRAPTGEADPPHVQRAGVDPVAACELGPRPAATLGLREQLGRFLGIRRTMGTSGRQITQRRPKFPRCS